MELHRIALRVALVYLFLHLMLRLSGKRTIGEDTAFDFIVALILADLNDAFWFNHVAASQYLVASGLLVATHVLVSMGTHLSDRFHRLVVGMPCVIMRDGKPYRPGMRDERMSLNEVEAVIRRLGIEKENWDQIELAVIESSGQPSMKLKEWAKDAQTRDLEKVRKVKQ